MKIWYRANLLQVTVTLINANQEVSVFAWCYVTRYLTNGVQTTLVFSPVVHTRRNLVLSRKTVFSSSRMIAATVRGQRASSFTDTLNLSTPKSLAEENSASSLTVQEEKITAFFQHFKRLLFLSSRINAKTTFTLATMSATVAWTLKTIDPCDLVDEENLHRRHVVDSSHFNMNNPFLCWRDLFSLWSWHPRTGIWSSLAIPGGNLPRTQLFCFGDSVGGCHQPCKCLLHEFTIWARDVILCKRAHLHNKPLLFTFFCMQN